MALTELQRDLCRLLAKHRATGRGSYVAGGAGLNVALSGTRRSRDIDLFHDTAEALVASWSSDREHIEAAGYCLTVLRERPSFVEALVQRGEERVVIEWSQDSAFRFFPLVAHAELGLTMQPFDLATNKVLALVGRREVRDFVDVVSCDEKVAPLGYLAWAAAGKDPGFSPLSIVEEAARSVRYTQSEVDALDFEGPAPNAAALASRWHDMLREARAIISLLPVDQVGTCALSPDGALCRASVTELATQVATLLFHPGSICGSWPEIRPLAPLPPAAD